MNYKLMNNHTNEVFTFMVLDNLMCDLSYFMQYGGWELEDFTAYKFNRSNWSWDIITIKF